jgi:hypothetical protein
MNASGQIAFGAALTGTGVTTSNDSGIWIGSTSGNLQSLAREGKLAPGTPAGVIYGSFFNDGRAAALNDNNVVAFRSDLLGTGITAANNLAIFSGSASAGISLVARKGDHALGTATGVTFSNLGAPLLSANGQVVFNATIAGPGINAGNDTGLWITDITGTAAQPLLREGDLFDVDDGPGQDLRTIATINVVLTPSNEYLDADGKHLELTLSFTDSTSGIFSIAPEPGALGTLALVMTIATLRRCRRSH